MRHDHFTNDEILWNVHTHLQKTPLEELQSFCNNDRLPWHTLCLNVLGDLSLGTIIRTSHCLGAKSVIIFGRKKIDNRSMVGSQNYTNIVKISGINDDLSFDRDKFFQTLIERNLCPIFIETNGIQMDKVNWQEHVDLLHENKMQPCLIMGNESVGIPEDFMNNCPIKHALRVSIPQRGVIRSLNVAVAHGIASWHLINEVHNWKNC
jgi:tRNA G18 (ribose-2'-O)-methylase SpoU